jgi:hypothetical protein
VGGVVTVARQLSHPRRGTATAAWALGVLGVGLVAAAAGFFAAGGHRVAALYGNEVGIAFGFTVVGAVVSARVSRNPLGWLMLAVGVVHAAGLAVLEWLSWLGPDVHSVPSGIVTYAEVSWLPGFVALFTLVPLLFPTGRPPTPRWAVLVWTTSVAGIVMMFAVVVGTKSWTDFGLANPAYHPRLANVVVLAGPVMVASVLGCVASVVVRYRRSTGAQRQQLRWFVWACGVATPVIAVELWLNRHNAVTVAVQFLVVFAIPLTIGVAILRYRLYDIDRVISRTVSYTVVTGMLIAVYVGGVSLTTQLLPLSSSVGVAASTLAAAALFQPIRRRVQSVVDHRFNRARYDAGRTIEAFAVRLRDEVDPDVVRADLLQVATRAIQPASISLWVAS